MTDQVAYWNGTAGERWVHEQASLDAMLRPFSQEALAASSVGPKDAVLDVGCGCGDTSLALAALVGPGGRVLGLDVSSPMLARAKERGTGSGNLSFRLGDASQEPLEPAAFDLLFSRFGVMFFADPTRAFAHLRGALRPTARLAFVCWRPLAENPWAKIPFEAAAAILGRPEPAGPDEPGPFSFGDPARVKRVLEGAGFRQVVTRAFDATNVFGGSAEDAAHELARLGPVARLLVDRDEATIARAIAAIHAALGPYWGTGGAARFPAAVWIVTASNAVT